MKNFRFHLIIFEFFLWGILWASPLGNLVFLNDPESVSIQSGSTSYGQKNDLNNCSLTEGDHILSVAKVESNPYEFSTSEKDKNEHKNFEFPTIKYIFLYRKISVSISSAPVNSFKMGGLPSCKLQI